MRPRKSIAASPSSRSSSSATDRSGRCSRRSAAISQARTSPRRSRPAFGAARGHYFAIADICLIPAQVGLGIVDAFAAGVPIATKATSARTRSSRRSSTSSQTGDNGSGHRLRDRAVRGGGSRACSCGDRCLRSRRDAIAGACNSEQELHDDPDGRAVRRRRGSLHGARLVTIARELAFTTSWDDGHPAPDLRVAEACLRVAEFTGTFYVPRRNLEGRAVLTTSELRTLGAGVEIGGHTADHVRTRSAQIVPNGGDRSTNGKHRPRRRAPGHARSRRLLVSSGASHDVTAIRDDVRASGFPDMRARSATCGSDRARRSLPDPHDTAALSTSPPDLRGESRRDRRMVARNASPKSTAGVPRPASLHASDSRPCSTERPPSAACFTCGVTRGSSRKPGCGRCSTHFSRASPRSSHRTRESRTQQLMRPRRATKRRS